MVTGREERRRENTAVFWCYWHRKARKQGVAIALKLKVRRVAEKLSEVKCHEMIPHVASKRKSTAGK